MGEFEKYLSKRIMGSEGWMYFCRICGQYQPESNFYKDSSRTFGYRPTCKKHFVKRDPDEDDSMKHLNLNKLTENDFVEAQKFLMRLGYKFDNGSPPVWVQFNQRHNLK